MFPDDDPQNGAFRLHRMIQERSSGPLPVRPWRVLHTIPGLQAHSILAVIHAQEQAGMRPFLLSEDGIVAGPPSADSASPPLGASLIRSWKQVREWKRQLDSYCFGGLEVVHAHCFSAGMAAVRRSGTVVYDLRVCIEDLVRDEISSGSERPWLARSMKAAEQFVLSRAGAIVVHSRAMLDGCRARGIAEESIFLVPEPIYEEVPLKRGARSAMSVARAYDRAYRHASANQRPPGGQNIGGGLVLQTCT